MNKENRNVKKLIWSSMFWFKFCMQKKYKVSPKQIIPQELRIPAQRKGSGIIYRRNISNFMVRILFLFQRRPCNWEEKLGRHNLYSKLRRQSGADSFRLY